MPVNYKGTFYVAALCVSLNRLGKLSYRLYLNKSTGQRSHSDEERGCNKNSSIRTQDDTKVFLTEPK